jgi:hypothetical protein
LAEVNQEVEDAAVAHVTAAYQGQGWDVSRVETERIGYDLHCSQGAEESSSSETTADGGFSCSHPTFLRSIPGPPQTRV